MWLQNPDHKADDRAEIKYKKYSEQYNDLQGMTFVPFVIYTTGKIHKKAQRFLEKRAEHAAERRFIAPSVLKNYYTKLLSVALIKRIGYVILVHG